MTTPPSHWKRRQALAALAALGATSQAFAVPAAAAPTGWVRPKPVTPALRLIDASGHRMGLSDALLGRATAVQLMFTGCNASCPLQGALFAAIAARMRSTDVQLLSISIDALGDTPESLLRWQERFGRHSAWHLAVADVQDVSRLADFVKGVPGKSGSHTAQVYLFDDMGQLTYRTGDSPQVREIEALLSRLSLPA